MNFNSIALDKDTTFLFPVKLNPGRVHSNNRTGCGVRRCRTVRNDWCNSFLKINSYSHCKWLLAQVPQKVLY